MMQELLDAPIAEEETETLHCTICQQPIPEARARRQTSTCSEKCKNRLDAIRAHQKASRRCPHCLNPSTPEERESYRLWRVERGNLRATNQVKRDSTLPHKHRMVQTLKQVTTVLLEERDRLATTVDSSPEIQAKLQRVTTLMNDCEALIQKRQTE